MANSIEEKRALWRKRYRDRMARGTNKKPKKNKPKCDVAVYQLDRPSLGVYVAHLMKRPLKSFETSKDVLQMGVELGISLSLNKNLKIYMATYVDDHARQHTSGAKEEDRAILKTMTTALGKHYISDGVIEELGLSHSRK